MAKQVGKSKTCPVRGISRCRVKMFEDGDFGVS